MCGESLKNNLFNGLALAFLLVKIDRNAGAAHTFIIVPAACTLRSSCPAVTQFCSVEDRIAFPVSAHGFLHN